MTRRVLTLEVDRHRLVGTWHDPGGHADIGVLLLSFGQQPRSWVGDLGAYAADRLCEAGYPVFRFDMPGLGDSPGEVPVHLEVLWREIQEGAHEATSRALVHALRRRHGYRGMVVGGFCGGAVSAVSAVDPRTRDVLGLVLLEPEMALTPTGEGLTGAMVDEVSSVESFVERLERAKERVLSPRAWVRLLSGKSDLGYWRGLVEYLVRRLRDRSKGEVLPPDANRKFIDAWRRSGDRGLPILVLSVGMHARTRYYASYGFGPGRAPARWKQAWIEIPGTTHALVAGGAKEAVPSNIERWLRASFPL